MYPVLSEKMNINNFKHATYLPHLDKTHSQSKGNRQNSTAIMSKLLVQLFLKRILAKNRRDQHKHAAYNTEIILFNFMNRKY